MVYALHNAILYNEAFACYIFTNGNSVASSGTPPTNTELYTNSALIAEATAFAQAVDTAIANDSTISDITGVALEPTTQSIQQAQFGKTAAVRGACLAFLCPGGSWLNWMPGGVVVQPATGRGSSQLGGNRAGGNNTWITTVGNQILALYLAMVAVMYVPAPS